ncbi:MAG: hypothetical protein CMK70_13440 [Pseudohongiella sp.]|nr:hypothetical protein [Pseudohongiella sp.]|tara:strand:+ start:31887 stop:32096 length:210 start_codon:yes stop_codon:yes gene_type:complete
MFPDINANPKLHNTILNVLMALPLLGLMSGKPTLMITTTVIAGIGAIPYFAAMAGEEAKQAAEKRGRRR